MLKELFGVLGKTHVCFPAKSLKKIDNTVNNKPRTELKI